jgi:hypothetical protein
MVLLVRSAGATVSDPRIFGNHFSSF